MFAHLAENCADVQVNVSRIEDLEAVVNALLAVVQVVIFNLESLF